MTSSDFADLQQRIREAGLLEKSPRPAAIEFAITFVMFLLSVGILFLTQNTILILLDAIFLAFLYGRFGLIAHDCGHMQVFRSVRMNNLWGHICGTVIGLSHPWWNDKHNKHHAHTNHNHFDPDIDLPILAYSEEQAQRKKGIARFIVKHQAWFFFPIQLLAAVSLRKSSWQYILLEGKRKDFPLDLSLSCLHAVLYLSIVFFTLTWWQAILFILVHQHMWSFYITSIFAPNHKGMPVLEGETVDFMREQILTARNIRPNLLTDFYYGHLNYQIEHHLFPTMPRHNLKPAKKIVKEFCREKGIHYHETSILMAYKEILAHMRRVSLCLN